MNTSVLDNLMKPVLANESTSALETARCYSSAVSYELTDSFHSPDIDGFENLLADHFLTISRIGHANPDWQKTPAYEIGKAAGICEAFAAVSDLRKKDRDLEKNLKSNLAHLREASRSVLRVLNRYADRNEWIMHKKLAAECNQSVSSLSNIISRLISIGAVEATKQGRTVLYRMSSSCEQYCRLHPEAIQSQAVPSYFFPEYSGSHSSTIRIQIKPIIPTVKWAQKTPPVFSNIPTEPAYMVLNPVPGPVVLHETK